MYFTSNCISYAFDRYFEIKIGKEWNNLILWYVRNAKVRKVPLFLLFNKKNEWIKMCLDDLFSPYKKLGECHLVVCVCVILILKVHLYKCRPSPNSLFRNLVHCQCWTTFLLQIIFKLMIFIYRRLLQQLHYCRCCNNIVELRAGINRIRCECQTGGKYVLKRNVVFENK